SQRGNPLAPKLVLPLHTLSLSPTPNSPTPAHPYDLPTFSFSYSRSKFLTSSSSSFCFVVQLPNQIEVPIRMVQHETKAHGRQRCQPNDSLQHELCFHSSFPQSQDMASSQLLHRHCGEQYTDVAMVMTLSSWAIGEDNPRPSRPTSTKAASVVERCVTCSSLIPPPTSTPTPSSGTPANSHAYSSTHALDLSLAL
ncbi:hypothetical protein Taro_016292, partial [Colocasia esculenta]|nr:hypothetical protein [Colocasia esculenta]